MSSKVKFNIDKIIDIFGDKIYKSNGSAFREQLVNALSHGCLQWYDEYGRDESVYVTVEFDHLHRSVVVHDNGMGMPEDTFNNVFAGFGFSENNSSKRSGKHGLGAMSFLRISSSTIVESWSRKTDEHYCYIIEEGKETRKLNNRLLEGFGTRIQMTLKKDVRISELRKTVKDVAKRYPVKTVLVETNTEVSQNTGSGISTYGMDETPAISDGTVVFEPVIELEDYIKKEYQTDQVTAISSIDENVQIWLNPKGRNEDIMLCRVPISLRRDRYELDSAERSVFDTLTSNFGIIVNILDERGDYTPEHHRDELELKSANKLIRIINESIIQFIGTVSINSIDEYRNSEYRWVLDAHGVDEYFRAETRYIMDYLKFTVKYRDDGGISKSKKTIHDIIHEYDHIFYSDTMPKVTFDAFASCGLFDPNRLVFIQPWYENYDDTARSYEIMTKLREDFEDAKLAKKRLKIKSVKHGRREITYNVHFKNHSQRLPMHLVETNPNIFYDNEIEYPSIKDLQEHHDSDWYQYFGEEQETEHAPNYGIICAKAHISKLDSIPDSPESKLKQVCKKERDVIIDGTLRRGTIYEACKKTTNIYPKHMKKYIRLLASKHKDNGAFVTKDEYELLHIGRLADRTGKLYHMDTSWKSEILTQNVMEDLQCVYSDYDFIHTYDILKSLKKARFALAIASMIIHDSRESKSATPETILDASIKLTRRIFGLDHSKRMEYCNRDTIEKVLKVETGVRITESSRSYNSDEQYEKIFRLIKTDADVLNDDVDKLEFDGYKRKGDDVYFYKFGDIALNELNDKVGSMLGYNTVIGTDKIQGRKAIIAKSTVQERIR